jgi:hypothetical protein
MFLCLFAAGWIQIVVRGDPWRPFVMLFELPTETRLICAACFGFWVWYFSMPENEPDDERRPTSSDITR